MLKIRLARTGKKNKAQYRVVVADARAPRDGAFVARLGYYDPTADPAVVVIDEEKARYWLGKGAQPTDTVGHLLKKQGVLEGATTE
jgi:small subunit ribosomal protein S16